MNTVNLIGRLTETPQTKYPTNENEVAVTHYTLAVNTWAKNKKETAYIRCTHAAHDDQGGLLPIRNRASAHRGTA